MFETSNKLNKIWLKRLNSWLKSLNSCISKVKGLNWA